MLSGWNEPRSGRGGGVGGITGSVSSAHPAYFNSCGKRVCLRVIIIYFKRAPHVAIRLIYQRPCLCAQEEGCFIDDSLLHSVSPISRTLQLTGVIGGGYRRQRSCGFMMDDTCMPPPPFQLPPDISHQYLQIHLYFLKSSLVQISF